MNPDALASARDAAWLYVAGPLLGIAALWLTVRLKAPQLRQLGAAFRSLREDPKAPGETGPPTASALAAVGSFGAAAAVGSATAIGIGGAGAIAWLWLIGFVVAPLRFAETLLARTSAPGKAGSDGTGSLAARLLRDDHAALRVLGGLLVVAVGATALAFVGGVHGSALADVAGNVLPDSVPWLLGGVAAVGAILAVAGARRAGSIAGWIGLIGLVVLLAVGLWAALSDPSRAFGALGRTIGEAIGGAPVAAPFVGAFAGEIAFAAIQNVLPPIGAATGASGGLQSLARARSTKAQAAASLLDPLAFAVVATVLAMAFVSTGAFYEQVEDERPLLETRFYRVGFETASQRDEQDRLHEGYVRITGGEMRDVDIEVGTKQGMVEDPTFLQGDRTADMALHLKNGRPFRILTPGERGSLTERPVAELRNVSVKGEMLPEGGALLGSAIERGTGGGMALRVALAALLALAAVLVGVWGLALRRSLPSTVPERAAVLIALLPAVGLGLQATGAVPWLAPVGGLAGAALAALAALALLLRAGEAADLE